MNYELIFDARDSGFREWWFPAIGLIFIAAGIFLLKNRKSMRYMFSWQLDPKETVKLGCFVLVFAVLWTTVASVSMGREYRRLRKALDGGGINVVEGPVSDFVPMPYQGHAQEHFTVCGVPFSYSDYGVTAGFNNTSSHGGPMRQGLWVRIEHVGSTIARLEIAKHAVPEGMQCRRGGRP